jgi:hypothetical protein
MFGLIYGCCVLQRAEYFSFLARLIVKLEDGDLRFLYQVALLMWMEHWYFSMALFRLIMNINMLLKDI